MNVRKDFQAASKDPAKTQNRLPAAALGFVLAFCASSAAFAADPAGDAAKGAKLFLQCRACHSVGQADPDGVGPNLFGVMGAKYPARPSYKYSAAFTAANLTWTPETMDAWLKKPTAVVPKTKMAFAGVASAQSRQDIIAYLSTLKAPKKKAKK